MKPKTITYSCRIRIPVATLQPWHGIVTPQMYSGRLIALEIQGRDLILTFERRLTLRERLFHSRRAQRKGKAASAP